MALLDNRDFLEEVGHSEYSSVLKRYTGSLVPYFPSYFPIVLLTLPQNVTPVRWMETINLLPLLNGSCQVFCDNRDKADSQKE